MVEISEAVCPYCDKVIDGSAVQFGGYELHPACDDALGAELAVLHGDDAMVQESNDVCGQIC